MSTLALAVCTLVLERKPVCPPTERPNSVTEPMITVSDPTSEACPAISCSRATFWMSGRSSTTNLPEATRREASMSEACLPMTSRSASYMSDRP